MSEKLARKGDIEYFEKDLLIEVLVPRIKRKVIAEKVDVITGQIDLVVEDFNADFKKYITISELKELLK